MKKYYVAVFYYFWICLSRNQGPHTVGGWSRSVTAMQNSEVINCNHSYSVHLACIIYNVYYQKNLIALMMWCLIIFVYSTSGLRCASFTIKNVEVNNSKPQTGENFETKNKRLNRPLSPHLTIYKVQATSFLSISHRITGMALSGVIYGLAAGKSKNSSSTQFYFQMFLCSFRYSDTARILSLLPSNGWGPARWSCDHFRCQVSAVVPLHISRSERYSSLQLGCREQPDHQGCVRHRLRSCCSFGALSPLSGITLSLSEFPARGHSPEFVLVWR